jgi:DNA polymerase
LSLAVLAKEIATCEKCPELFSTRTQTVFGVGPMSPELLFLGEAPGADEDRQGVPFVGAAGQYLNRIITGCGFRNILKCRPPGNATPNATQCANCRPYLDRQLELIRPKVICCLGGVAAKNLLNTSTGIMKLRGQKYDYRGTPVFCTYHPSYLIRMEGDALQNAKRECWDDMKMILRHLGRPIPQKN